MSSDRMKLRKKTAEKGVSLLIQWTSVYALMAWAMRVTKERCRWAWQCLSCPTSRPPACQHSDWEVVQREEWILYETLPSQHNVSAFKSQLVDVCSLNFFNHPPELCKLHPSITCREEQVLPFHSAFLQEREKDLLLFVWRWTLHQVCLTRGLHFWLPRQVPPESRRKALGLQRPALLPGPNIGCTQTQKLFIQLHAKLLHGATPSG